MKSEFCMIKNVIMNISFMDIRISILTPFAHKLSSRVSVVRVTELW